MTPEEAEKLRAIFETHPSLKLVYFFGSRATGKVGPLSDYDFALYVDEKESAQAYRKMLAISADISKILKTDLVDTVLLNFGDSPELKYAIIAEGKLIYEIEPYKLIIEPKIMTEYFDFRAMLRRHNLTRT